MNQRKRGSCYDSQSNLRTSSTFTFSPLLVFSIRKGLLVEREIINPFQDIVEGIRDQLTCGCRLAPSIMAQCIRIRVMPTRTGDKFLSGARLLDLVLAWPSTWPVIVRSPLQTKDNTIKVYIFQLRGHLMYQVKYFQIKLFPRKYTVTNKQKKWVKQLIQHQIKLLMYTQAIRGYTC